MKIINFKNLEEKVYFEKLNNGIEVYLYPTKKSKNFYATISTRYGSSVLSYKKSDKNIEIIPGTAHFLEHKIMNFTTNEEFFKRVNALGAITNAYTTYELTNYNIFGSDKIIENLDLLFDMVMNPILTKENIESEVGIISEEIDMDKDDINTDLYNRKNKNLFFKDFPINHILGEKKDINKITEKYLKTIYKDFYRPNNMFVIVVGDFDIDNTFDFIKKKLSVMKSNKNKIIINKIKEPDKVRVTYEKVQKDIFDEKVYYSFKMNKNLFKDFKKYELNKYLSVILNSNFSQTSPIYEKYKLNNLITSMKADFKIFGNHLIITIKASTTDSQKFINNIKNDILNLELDEETFIRKRKKLLSELILSFENIEDIEYLITVLILTHKKLFNKEYEVTKELDYKKATLLLKKLNFDNSSILVCTK